jgi:ribonuclease E
MQATPKPAQQPSSADIDTLLREAGLMMAVTDPEKLRAVQAASDNVTPKPRVPRERKPAAPVSNEPLVQVETQR